MFSSMLYQELCTFFENYVTNMTPFLLLASATSPTSKSLRLKMAHIHSDSKRMSEHLITSLCLLILSCQTFV